jgi:hypothetical protein
MTFKSKFNLGDVLSSDSLLVEFEQFLPNDRWINITKPHWEEHLAVSMQLFKHLSVAVLQIHKEVLQLLKYLLFGLRWVDPLSEGVEYLLLVDLSVLLSSKLCVDLSHP